MQKTNKKLKTVALVVLSLILVYTATAICPVPKNFGGDNPMMKDGEIPILIAHGGGNREFPDNTLEAFYNAYSVDNRVMMETDVSITRDGVLILSHDTTLDRKTNVTGAIADWNYSDLIAERVDFGYTNPTENEKLNGERKYFTTDEGERRFPTDVDYPEGVTPRDEEVFLATTLEELITSFPNNRINVEIKQEGELGKKALTEALRLVDKHDAWDRIVLASFHDEIYEEFCRLGEKGEVPEEFMYSPAIGGVVRFFLLQAVSLDVFFTDGMCVFQLPMEEMGISLATKGLVKNAHSHNLAVHFWTIDDKEDMRYLIEIGADGIMTNYPHRLKEVYDEYSDGLGG